MVQRRPTNRPSSSSPAGRQGGPRTRGRHAADPTAQLAQAPKRGGANRGSSLYAGSRPAHSARPKHGSATGGIGLGTGSGASAGRGGSGSGLGGTGRHSRSSADLGTVGSGSGKTGRAGNRGAASSVGLGGGSASSTGPRKRTGNTGSMPRVSARGEREPGTISIPGLLDGERITLTRRQALVGVAGVAALAAAAAGGRAVSSAREEQEQVGVLEVPEDAVFGLDELETLDASDCMQEQIEVRLPYRTLVWASSDSYACCLIPTDGAAPLTQVGIVSLGDGGFVTAVERPATTGNGYDIVDARCNDQGILWVEANAFTDEWRVYHATHSALEVGEPTLADSGDGNFDIPSIAVAGGHAFWQVLPKKSMSNPPASVLKAATFGDPGVVTVLESNGRMCTPLYAASEGIVVSPRSDTASVHYQLTLVDADSFKVKDTLTMPTSMAPMAAGYVDGRFAFAFDAIYNYGEGLGKLGTYVPVDQGDPTTGAQWFCVGRNPMAAPAWCGPWLIVKSTRSVSGVDIASRTAFSLSCPDHCDTFGDFLATTGTRNTVVTYVHIKNGDDAYTLLRTWTA